MPQGWICTKHPLCFTASTALGDHVSSRHCKPQHLLPAALPSALEERMGGLADKPLPSCRLGF